MEPSKKINDIIVKEIRLKRIQLGLTQAELAKKVGISPITYGHIETCRRELKIIELYNLCKYLDLPIEETLSNCICKQYKSEQDDDSISYKGEVVAFTSFKGGAGVSTLTALFCNKISSQYNILMIDAHEQLSCYNMRKNDMQLYTDIKPQYEIKAVGVDKVSSFLETVRNDYDYVIIDLPRFFYYDNDLKDIFVKCNYVFAPFYLSEYHEIKEEYDEYIQQVDGRLDLFIELRAKIKELNGNISFTLISFQNDMTVEFQEWIENYDINLLPQTFKKHYELQSHIDTLTDLSKNEDIAYAPYVIDTLNLIYYLERETSANLFIEEQNN